MSNREQLQPLGDRVLLKRLAEEDKYHGIIHLPDKSKEKPQVGIVIDIGGEHEYPIKVGDRVLFGRYSGTDIKLNDEDFIVIREEDLIGILHEKEE